MKNTVKPKETKEKKVKTAGGKVRFCGLCMRELPEGVYRFNDMDCPPLPKGIPDTRTCMEDCMLQNQAMAKAYFEIAEKKRFEEGENSKEAKYFEKQAKALIRCGK